MKTESLKMVSVLNWLPLKKQWVCTVMLGLSAACGSEISQSEKEARISKTFDLKGQYVELTDSRNDQAEKAQASQMVIVNESGTHDLAVTVSIQKPFETEDEQALRHHLSAKAGLSESGQNEAMLSLSSHLRSMNLGTGSQFQFRGGENVVLDAVGKTSEVAVYSNSKKLYGWKHSDTESREINLKSYFYFTAHRDDRLVDFSVTSDTDAYGKNGSSGKGLWLEFEMRRVINDESGTRIEQEEIDMRQIALRPMVLRKKE